MKELLKICLNSNVRVLFKQDSEVPAAVTIWIIYNFPDSTRTLSAQMTVTDAFIEYVDDAIRTSVISHWVMEFRGIIKQHGQTLIH